jgi:hypothetical protein
MVSIRPTAVPMPSWRQAHCRGPRPIAPIVSASPYFRGGVTPAGNGTCATFSVIDTRL